MRALVIAVLLSTGCMAGVQKPATQVAPGKHFFSLVGSLDEVMVKAHTHAPALCQAEGFSSYELTTPSQSSYLKPVKLPNGDTIHSHRTRSTVLAVCQ